MITENPYARDAEVLMGIAWSAVGRGVSRVHRVQATLCLALAIERLLKGILHEVNPLYAYEVQSFEHSLQVQYKDRIVADLKKNERKPLAETPNSKTLSLPEAAMRARLVCTVVGGHYGAIQKLAQVRNQICHG